MKKFSPINNLEQPPRGGLPRSIAYMVFTGIPGASNGIKGLQRENAQLSYGLPKYLWPIVERERACIVLTFLA